MKLEQIAARAIKAIKSEHKELTPGEFERAFCKELKKEGVNHEDCEKLSRFISKLDENYQKLLKSYNPKAIDELIVFLISQVNRLNPSEINEYLTAQFILVQKVLKVIKQLRYKEASKLASNTLDKMENTKNSELLMSLAREWDSLAANYKPNEFSRLDALVHLNSFYLDDIAAELKIALERNRESFDDIVILVLEGLKPSFSKEMQKEIELFSKKLLADSEQILQKKVQNDIKALVSKRIVLDNKALKTKISEIDSMVTSCYAKISGVSDIGASGAQKVGSIKKLIEGSKEGDFEAVKVKLSALVSALDNDLKSVIDTIKSENEQMEQLKSKIKHLESELESAKEEAGIDFLTKLSNRRVIDDELKRYEEIFLRFGDNYSIVLFDIDFFKKINDSYGHMAGDVVLASFSQILKKKARDIDIVGRFGGEEFIAILPKTDKTGAATFAESVRQSVENTKFIYKESRIKVSVSAGCADRKECENIKEIIKIADERLYSAKQSGRNRVKSE